MCQLKAIALSLIHLHHMLKAQLERLLWLQGHLIGLYLLISVTDDFGWPSLILELFAMTLFILVILESFDFPSFASKWKTNKLNYLKLFFMVIVSWVIMFLAVPY